MWFIFYNGYRNLNEVIGVEPTKRNILSSGNPCPHKIQGIGAGFIPGNLHQDVIDEVIEICSLFPCYPPSFMLHLNRSLIGTSFSVLGVIVGT
nr:cysteine synthase, chloroplastic/chromoplastic [Tanacetum cinerariifolium]